MGRKKEGKGRKRKKRKGREKKGIEGRMNGWTEESKREK